MNYKVLPQWTVADFKIKQTRCGYYSVYYSHDEKSICLCSHLRELTKATSYIDWLVNFTNEMIKRIDDDS